MHSSGTWALCFGTAYTPEELVHQGLIGPIQGRFGLSGAYSLQPRLLWGMGKHAQLPSSGAGTTLRRPGGVGARRVARPAWCCHEFSSIWSCIGRKSYTVALLYVSSARSFCHFLGTSIRWEEAQLGYMFFKLAVYKASSGVSLASRQILQ